MNDTQSYNHILPILDIISADEVRKLDMPIDVAVHEGRVMGTLATQDKDALTMAGLSPKVISEVNMAASALRVAEAKLLASLGDKSEIREQWLENESRGYELRSDMARALSFALRGDRNALNKIAKIREGARKSDLIQDLRSYYQLAKNYLEELEKIKSFDMNTIEESGKAAEVLCEIWAVASLEPRACQNVNIRDRVFTYMRRQMSEVLATAEYVLHDDPDRLSLYYSSWRRRQRNSAEKSTPSDILKDELITAV
ncbi:hypothetical protein QA601_01855 [Chitinispirillales bacterium ANBcel5]|uniref:hypothetical protein n=1 Tax=Cellulosispirillum alkaliphilum TaxID=3039283 RepID=UPI002A518F7B|nr:hypothetical protein [Chitinispirillales bacterium ANBcel5]